MNFAEHENWNSSLIYSFLSLHTYIFIRKLSYKISSNPTKCARVAKIHSFIHAKPRYIFWVSWFTLRATSFGFHGSHFALHHLSPCRLGQRLSNEVVGWSSKVVQSWSLLVPGHTNTQLAACTMILYFTVGNGVIIQSAAGCKISLQPSCSPLIQWLAHHY
jgi:hypothetical protein